MLVVETVLPEGPAHGKMEEGDILLTINGQYITRFVPLEAMLDSNVGKDIDVVLERGGETLELTVRTGDLHAM